MYKLGGDAVLRAQQDLQKRDGHLSLKRFLSGLEKVVLVDEAEEIAVLEVILTVHDVAELLDSTREARGELRSLPAREVVHAEFDESRVELLFCESCIYRTIAHV